MVDKFGLEHNNRGRVIALAMYCDNLLQNPLQITCVADRDFDHVLGVHHEVSCLLFSDFANVEMYLFTASVLQKYLTLVHRDIHVKASDLLTTLVPVLMFLFAVRLVNHRDEMGLEAVDWLKSCTLRGGALVFDQDDYISRYLNKNARFAEKCNFERAIQEALAVLTCDSRHCMHGHDFISALHWYLRRASSVKPDPDLFKFGRSLMLSLEAGKLAAQPMFDRLLARLDPN